MYLRAADKSNISNAAQNVEHTDPKKHKYLVDDTLVLPPRRLEVHTHFNFFTFRCTAHPPHPSIDRCSQIKHLNAVCPSYDTATWEKHRVENKKVCERLRTVSETFSSRDHVQLEEFVSYLCYRAPFDGRLPPLGWCKEPVMEFLLVLVLQPITATRWCFQCCQRRCGSDGM